MGFPAHVLRKAVGSFAALLLLGAGTPAHADGPLTWMTDPSMSNLRAWRDGVEISANVDVDLGDDSLQALGNGYRLTDTTITYISSADDIRKEIEIRFSLEREFQVHVVGAIMQLRGSLSEILHQPPNSRARVAFNARTSILHQVGDKSPVSITGDTGAIVGFNLSDERTFAVEAGNSVLAYTWHAYFKPSAANQMFVMELPDSAEATVNFVPEPSTAALLGAGLGLLLLGRRAPASKAD